MANNLDVKITADVVDLQQKFAVARAEASSLSSEMGKLAKSSAAGTLDTAGQSQFAKIAQDYLQAKNSAASYSSALKDTSAATKGFGDSISDARSKLSTLFQVSGAAAAYEAIHQLIDLVGQFGERAMHVMNMADMLEVTTDQYQAMGAAAEASGVSEQVFDRAMEHLKNTLNEARNNNGSAISSLVQLGVTTEQIANKSVALPQILEVISGRLQNVGTESAEKAALLQVLGNRAALVGEALKGMDLSTAAVAQRMKELNAPTEEQNKELAKNAVEMKEVGTWAENTGEKFLLFAENTDKTAVKVALAIANITTAAGQAQTVMQTFGKGGSTAPQIAAQQQLTDVTVSSTKLMTTTILEGEQANVQATATGTAQRVALARQYYEDSRKYYGSGSVSEVRAAYNEYLSAQKEFTAAAVASMRTEAEAAMQKDRDDVASYREALSQMKEADKEFETINRQNADADIEIQRAAVAAKKSLLEAEVGDVASASAAKFAALKQLTNQEYDLDQQALQNELKGLEDEPAEYNRVYNQIRELKAKQVQELAALDQQQATAARRAAQQDSQGWKDSVNEIESAESSLLGNLINKRKSLGASLVQVGAQLAQQEIQNDVKAMTTRWLLASNEANSEKALEQGGLLFHLLNQDQLTEVTVTAQKMQTQAVIAGNQARTAATASGAASSKAAGASANAGVVMADAAKAFSGTYASVAQIPYVGWILAPAAGAAAFAAVAAYQGLASLDVGAWNIPHDMPAQLHKGESVVPTTFAEGLRASGGVGGEAEQGAGGDIHIHNHISAWDHASVADMVKSPAFRQTLVDAAKLHFSRGGR